MGYVKDTLMPGEKVLFTARIHPAIFLSSIVLLTLSIAFLVSTYGKSMLGGWVAPRAYDSSLETMDTMLLCTVSLCILYAILLGLKALVIVATTEFAVTNRRIIAKRGLIRRHTLEMLLSKVESVSVNQNIPGRLLNFGTVTVTGTGGTQESFQTIVAPLEVRRQINRIIESHVPPLVSSR